MVWGNTFFAFSVVALAGALHWFSLTITLLGFKLGSVNLVSTVLIISFYASLQFSVG